MCIALDRRRCLYALFVTGLTLVGCHRSGTTPEGSLGDASDTESRDGTGPSTSEGETSATSRATDYHPTVAFETSFGKLTIRLDAQSAPRTVHNFLHYVESGYYNQTVFHQVDAGYVIVGGGYTAELAEKQPRYPIPNEAANGRKNLRGTVAMARQADAIDSATCQFFVNLSDNPHLDHRGGVPEEFGYCVFGDVVEGLDVLERIAEVKVQSNEQFEKVPVETVLIESAYRVR